MQPVGLRCPRYEILAFGPVPPERVRLSHRTDLDLLPSGKLEARIEDLCQALRGQGRRVERLPVYRVGSWQATGHLHLQVGITDYGVALAQRLHPEWFQERLPTLAVCGVTLCANQAIVERRSQLVALSAGLIHVKPSGNVVPPEGLWEAVLREAQEELALKLTDLAPNPQVLGLCSCYEVLMDVVFRLPCRLSPATLVGALAQDAWEHEGLLTVDCSPAELARWCDENFGLCSPPGHAALVMEGWARYGPDWLEGLRGGLAQGSGMFTSG